MERSRAQQAHSIEGDRYLVSLAPSNLPERGSNSLLFCGSAVRRLNGDRLHAAASGGNFIGSPKGSRMENVAPPPWRLRVAIVPPQEGKGVSL
jgi:hypothetical protein